MTPDTLTPEESFRLYADFIGLGILKTEPMWPTLKPALVWARDEIDRLRALVDSQEEALQRMERGEL